MNVSCLSDEKNKENKEEEEEERKNRWISFSIVYLKVNCCLLHENDHRQLLNKYVLHPTEIPMLV